MVEKYVKDGQVAILITSNYGAGWSTWNNSDKKEYLLFDKALVELALKGSYEKLARMVLEHFPDDYVCVLGAGDLKVKFVPIGSQFIVSKYDGPESLEYLHNMETFTA